MSKVDKIILLDEDAFQCASTQLGQLAEDLEKLRKDIDELLLMLKEGFDTPAGKKFIDTYQNGLLEPMERQSLVIRHVSDNLTQASNMYQSVFLEFQSLNNSINNV